MREGRPSILEAHQVLVRHTPMGTNCMLAHRHNHLEPGGCKPHPCGCGEPAVYGFGGVWWCSGCYIRGLVVVRQS